MSQKEVINVSIHQDRGKEVNEVLKEISNREMSISSTICRLLLEFKNNGYQFKSEAE